MENSKLEISLLGSCWGKTAPENPPIPLNSLSSEDSTDSDKDLAEELHEFFRSMIWDDFSGEEEEEKSSFTEDEELEGSLTELMILMTSSLMMMILIMTDIYLKHPTTE